MRRDSNRRQRPGQSFENKVLIAGGVILLLIIGLIIGMSMYSSSVNKNAKQFTSEQIASLVPNNTEDDTTSEAESASSSIGKSVDESKNTINNTVTNNKATNNTTKQNNANNTTTNSTSKSVSKSKKDAENLTKQNSTVKNTTTTKETKEISFAKPVEGDVIREFAKDNLVYSETLQEWVTHLGIDIKANKTTVVKASADGTVKSIKNDPRYGLTIIIDHDDGYQTIYSNLLTTEFVVEGEKVKQGQSIGTVGNTAVFEISDESHLHFEILKDSEQLDPNIYIK